MKTVKMNKFKDIRFIISSVFNINTADIEITPHISGVYCDWYRNDNKIEVVISSSNDSTVNFSAKVWVNKNVVPIRYEVYTSSAKKVKINGYLNEHKDEYKKIISEEIKRRVEIIS